MHIDIGKIFKFGSTHLMLITALLVAVWTIGRPHAEQFVKDTVDSRIEKVENAINKLRKKQKAQITAQNALTGEVTNSVKLQEQSSKDLKAILKVLEQ